MQTIVTKHPMTVDKFFGLTLINICTVSPIGNQLICSGDFNCALQMQLPWSGTHGFRWQGRRHQGYQHRDHRRFQNLLADHHLVALNTWDESKGPTYYHGEYAARIDSICTRIHACDGKSKDVAYLNTAEFVPLNATHHIPLLASIRKLPVQYHVTRVPKACNLDQRARCRQAQIAGSAPMARFDGESLCSSDTPDCHCIILSRSFQKPS